MVLATDMTKNFTDISKIKSGIQESCKETIERERERETGGGLSFLLEKKIKCL